MRKTYLSLSRTNSITKASSIILDAVMRYDSVDAGVFYLYEPKRSRLKLLETRNICPFLARIIEEFVPGKDEWMAPVYEEKKPVFAPYCCLASRYADTDDERHLLQNETLAAVGIVPVLHDDQVIAILGIGSRSGDTFPDETTQAILELAREAGATLHRILSAAERTEASQARERMLSAVTDNLSFLQKEWDMGTVLTILGESLDIDRAYIYKFRNGLNSIEYVHEWCAPGVEPRKALLQGAEIDRYSWWFSRHTENKVTVIRDIRSFPPEAGMEREMYNRLGVKSSLFVPIFVEGGLWGSIGFHQVFYHRDWNDEDVRTIRIVAKLFEDAIVRKRLTEQLLRQNEELKAHAELMDAYAQSLFHEAQSPLVSIYSYAELIREYADAKGEDELKEMVAVIERNIITQSNVAKKIGFSVRDQCK
jgi:GAF domain-containing protein